MLTQANLIENGIFHQRMPQEKIGAFFRELPWLHVWLDNENRRDKEAGLSPIVITQIYVSGIDLSFGNLQPIKCEKSTQIDRKGNTFYRTKGMSADFHFEEIYLLGENGSVLEYEVERVSYRRKYFFFGKEEIRKKYSWRAIAHAFRDDTMDDAMARLGDSVVLVKYAVSYCAYTRALIIYKPPRGFGIFEWLMKQGTSRHSSVEAEVKAEIAATEG